jgi:histidinol-phosphate aminotransferase
MAGLFYVFTLSIMFDLNALVRENIKVLQPYSSARDEFQGEAAVFLDANESPYGDGLNRYPDPLQRRLKKEIGPIKNMDPEQILLGNGSDEVIDLLIRAFCEPAHDNILILPPTYGMYKVSANIHNVAVREVFLAEEFQPDVPGIFKTINNHTKLVFVCSPNNPSGNLVKQACIVEILSKFEGIVVVDEAYIDFSPENTILGLLKQYPNLVVMQTFSKAMSGAGIRLGMCFASKEIISVLNRIKPPYNINELTQQAAFTLLRSLDKISNQVSVTIHQRKLLSAQLQEFDFVKKVYPSDANFLLVKTSDAGTLYNYLLTKGIVVRDRSSAPLCSGCLRITIGKPEENKFLVETLKLYHGS